MFEYNGNKIHWLGHDSFLIESKYGNIYLDPFKLTNSDLPKADIVICSHEHHDHCHIESINLISKESTFLLGPKVTQQMLQDGVHLKQAVKELNPGDSYEVNHILISAIPAYNTHRFRTPDNPFHPKESGHIGPILNIDGTIFYHAGDTDLIEEMEQLKVQLAFLPISGTYVMDVDECLEATKLLKPKIVIPMHVGRGIGKLEFIQEFAEKLNNVKDIEVRILELEE